MTSLIICADDYAQSPAIDEAILALIAHGVLTATSCMTLSPGWPQSARQLTAEIRARADLGVHLDFTQYSQSVRYPHPVLMARSLTGRLDATAVSANIHQQLDAFEQALHTPPDYIDGHLHVHQLPVIREALVKAMLTRYGHLPPTQRPWLRISSPPAGSGLKARIIHWLGAEALKALASAAGFRVSPVLLGVYDFQGDASTYQAHWIHWAKQLKQLPTPAGHDLPPVLMCHPARPTQTIDPEDPIAIARMLEWQVMHSADFAAWLPMADIQPVTGQSRGLQ